MNDLTDAEKFATCVHSHKLSEPDYLFFDYAYWEWFYEQLLSKGVQNVDFISLETYTCFLKVVEGLPL